MKLFCIINVISKNEDDDVLLEDFNDWLKEIGISNRELTRFMKNYLYENI